MNYLGFDIISFLISFVGTDSANSCLILHRAEKGKSEILIILSINKRYTLGYDFNVLYVQEVVTLQK